MTFPFPPSAAPMWPQVVQDLLRLYAPTASFAGQLDHSSVRIDTGGIQPLPAGPLDPPEEWLDSGVLDWISVDGHLLGLLWSPAGVPTEVIELLNLFLGSLQRGMSAPDFQMLLTQLPMPTAWLDMNLKVLEVSRSFLELFGMQHSEVVGHTVRNLPLGQALKMLEDAAQGHGQPDEWPQWSLPDPQNPGQLRWLRTAVKPFYTGQQSGLLWTVQDISAEQQQRERLQALLSGLGVPAAILNLEGEIQQANQALQDLNAESLGGRRLQQLALFSREGQQTVSGLLPLAADGGAALAKVERHTGGTLQLELRRPPEHPGLLVAQVSEPARRNQGPGADEKLTLLQEVLNQQNTATLLVDNWGNIQLINDQAARIAGVDAARLLGKDLVQQIVQLDINLLTPQGEAMPLAEWLNVPLPYQAEISLESPALGRRPMELRISAVVPQHAASGTRQLLMVTLRDLSELKRAQAQAAYGVHHDQLTGLPNRAGLRQRLSQLPTPQSGALMVAELDEYAALTTATDITAIHHLLMQLAASFRTLATNHGGDAARLSDNTFAAWLPGLTLEEARAAAAQAVRGPFRLGRDTADLTFAVGLDTIHSQPLDTALGNAEIAAQYARRRGRGQVTVYSEALRSQLAETFRLEQSLRDSVATGQLNLHYQPTLHLSSREITGAEALLRWQRPDQQLPPHELLEMAVQLGLLGPLSDWVVREALQQQLVWNELRPQFRLGINVSLNELRQPGALGALWPLLEQFTERGVPLPNIEISAGSLSEFSAEDASILEQLHKGGAAVWVDHFGDGPLSLMALTEVPVHGLKLHPKLVAHLTQGGRRADLVAGTLDLAGRMGLEVTAVGVETDEQLERLRQLGCQQAQGYAIAPPMAASELSTWLRQPERKAL